MVVRYNMYFVLLFHPTLLHISHPFGFENISIGYYNTDYSSIYSAILGIW
jgi:hypothetical protein